MGGLNSHAVVTGANTGLGKQTALALADYGYRVICAGLSRLRTQPVIEQISSNGGDATFVPLDLASLTSVRRAVDLIADRCRTIDVLVANAGVAGASGFTKDGFEMTVGVNHIGHFALVQGLRPAQERAADAKGKPSRLVIVSSNMHRRIKKRPDLNEARRPRSRRTGVYAYALSKLCNILHASEYSRRYAARGVSTYSLTPGAVATDVWRHTAWPWRTLLKALLKSPEKGMETSLFCATHPSVAQETGRYYKRCRPVVPSLWAQDRGLASELWERSERWTSP